MLKSTKEIFIIIVIVTVTVTVIIIIEGIYPQPSVMTVISPLWSFILAFSPNDLTEHKVRSTLDFLKR